VLFIRKRNQELLAIVARLGYSFAMKTNARLFFPLLLVLYMLQLAYYWPMLPARVASHFDAAGRANGWQTREEFYAAAVLVALVLSIIFRVIPFLLHRLPVQFINLPNKDFWLASERKERTIADLDARMTVFGSATLGLLMIVMHFALEANLRPGGSLSAVWMIGALVGYATFSLVWMILMIQKYRRPPQLR
jgi:uncharacterized membrane protein